MPTVDAGIANSTSLQGAKIALLCGGDVLAYLRDDFAHIPNPGEWDLPGGVREVGETALDCALRETYEEFGIHITPATITHAALYTAQDPYREVAFFAAEIAPETVAQIVFGEEGQRWQMMVASDFVARTDAVAELRACLDAYLRRQNGQTQSAESMGNSQTTRD